MSSTNPMTFHPPEYPFQKDAEAAGKYCLLALQELAGKTPPKKRVGWSTNDVAILATWAAHWANLHLARHPV